MDILTHRKPTEGFPVRISRRLSLALAGIILTVLLVGGVSLGLAIRIYRINHKANQEHAHVLVIDQIQSAFNGIIFDLQQMQAAGQFNRTADVQAMHVELAQHLESFRTFHQGDPNFPKEAQEPAVLTDLRALAGDLQGLTNRLTAGGSRSRQLTPGDLERLDLISRQVAKKAKDLGVAHRLRTAKLSEASQGMMQALVGIYLAFTLVGGILITVASIGFSRGIAAPLRTLSDAALRVAEGRLNERVPVWSRSEIGQLSHSFNVMADQLEARQRALQVANDHLQQKVQEIQALYQIATEILALHGLDSVLRTVVTKARQLLRGDSSALCLASPGQEELLLRATSGPPDAFRSVRRRARCMTTSDGLSEGQKTCPVIQREYLQAHLKAPLCHRDTLIGFLCVGGRQAREFTAADAELLTGLAMQAALAIENARLYEDVRSLAAVQERERLAREMHDGLAQALALLQLKLERTHERVVQDGRAPTAEELRDIVGLTEHVYEEVRQSIFGLRAMVSRGLGLIPTLTEYLREYSIESGILVELEVANGQPIVLAPASEVQLVRIVQEALTNVRKHARATHAWVRLQRQESWLQVIIEDNGQGCEPVALASPDRRHLGHQTMRERAEGLGGRLEIDTAPGRGMRIVATLPAEAEDD